MLYITNLQMFPDGRSLIETTGTYRFKIMSYIWQNGYPMAKVERIEDIAYADEENMEAAERMIPTTPGDPITLASLSHLSTQELHRQGMEFYRLYQKVVIDSLGLTHAFRFDQHFRQFGTVTVVP